MHQDSVDDLSLARAVAAGDESALRTLYARCADPLFAFICHHLDGASADVEEIWQETLVAAFGSLDRYSGRSRFFTWLCSIARRKIADYYRHRGRSVTAFSDIPTKQLDSVIDAAPLPENILAQRETRIQVVRVLGTLPEDYRRVLLARYADRCSVDEVAQLLGTSYKAAESLLARARAAFRTAFCEVEPYDE